MKQAYLVWGYCKHTCSECGVKYTDKEYYTYYSLDKIMKYHINCKKCGAVFHEEPKRCYWDEHYPDHSCGCSERTEINGIQYCSRQLTARKRELQQWGCYYSCECYKPPKTTDEFVQLSFF